MNAVVIQGAANLSYPYVYGGNLTYCSGTISGATVSSGNVSQNCSAFDFAGTNTFLAGISASLANLPATGTPTCAYGSCALAGTSTASVFFLSGSVLASVTALAISAPAQSYVILNVNGTANMITNFGTTLTGGVTPQYIILNFYQATTVTVISSTVVVRSAFANRLM